LTDGLNAVSTQEAQDAAAASDNVPNGTTTLEQLARVRSGTGHYDFSGAFSSGGTMTGKMVIDFANQQIGVAGSDVWVTQSGYTVTSHDGTYQPQSFSNISSSGTFNFESWGFNESGQYVGDFDISVALSNQNGTTAGQATADLTYTAGSGATPYEASSLVSSGTSTGSGTLQTGP
jgi:hypothetical protein